MLVCHGCSRHIRVSESACPFCGAAIATVPAPSPRKLGAMALVVGLGVFGCSDSGSDDAETSGMTGMTMTESSSSSTTDTSTGSSTDTSTDTGSTTNETSEPDTADYGGPDTGDGDGDPSGDGDGDPSGDGDGDPSGDGDGDGDTGEPKLDLPN